MYMNINNVSNPRRVNQLSNKIYGKGVGTTAVAEPAKKTRRSSVKKKAADTSSIEEATEVKTEDTATDTEPKAEA